MTRHIDQDPQNNNTTDTEAISLREPSPAQVPNPRGYTETPLREAIGRHIPYVAEQMPDHIPSHVVADPNNTSAREIVPIQTSASSKEKTNLLVKGVAIGAATISLLGVGGKVAYDKLAEPKPTETALDMNTNFETIHEVPTLSPEAVDAQKRFDANREAINADFRQDLINSGHGHGDYFEQGAGPSFRDMSPDEILFRNVAAFHWINDRKAYDDIGLIAKPGSGAYSQTTATLSNPDLSGHAATDVLLAAGTPHRFSEGTYAGIESHGNDTWAIPTTGAVRGKYAINVFEWQQTPDGTGGEWVMVDTVATADTIYGFDSTYDSLFRGYK